MSMYDTVVSYGPSFVPEIWPKKQNWYDGIPVWPQYWPLYPVDPIDELPEPSVNKKLKEKITELEKRVQELENQLRSRRLGPSYKE